MQGLHGGTSAAVSRKLKAGTLDEAIGEDGFLDHEIADKLWSERTSAAPKNGSGISLIKQIERSDAENGVPISGTVQEWSIRKLAAEALGKEQDIRERQDAVIDREVVKKAWCSLYAETTNALLGVPTELAQPLAAELEPAKCQIILAKRIREILEGLPQEFEDSIVA